VKVQVIDGKMQDREIGVDRYFRDLKRLVKPRIYDKIQYLDIVISEGSPIEVQIHYQDKDLEDEHSRKGVKIPHHLYNFDKDVKITYDNVKFDAKFDFRKPHVVRKDCFRGGMEIYECKIEIISESPRKRSKSRRWNEFL
jgi:hypothetical protein